MLSVKTGKMKNEYMPDYVVFDLETTGISNKYDSIIEISAVKVRNGKIVDEYSKLVNPGRHIPERASFVNHIYDDMVYDKPAIDKVLPEFIEFIGDDLLVGHNIHSFDMKFIYRDCRMVFCQIPDNDYADSLYLARKCFPELNHHRLSDLADCLHLSTENAHRALYDCRMNQAVFEEIGRRLSALTK